MSKPIEMKGKRYSLETQTNDNKNFPLFDDVNKMRKVLHSIEEEICFIASSKKAKETICDEISLEYEQFSCKTLKDFLEP